MLPVSAQDAAELRADEASRVKEQFTAQPVDGGVGLDSWSVNPVSAGPWLVFRSGDRLVKVGQNRRGDEQLEAVKAVARTVDSLPGGIRPAPAARREAKCERGTAAAEALLGAKAAARRDEIVDGLVTCRWGTLRKAVVVEGGGPDSDAAAAFRNLKSAAQDSRLGNKRVAVGAEGWQQDNGFLAYKVDEKTFVTVDPYPLSPAESASILALARAIRPAYAG
ncbi:hypothetical protein [Kribbella sp. NPDC051770]|uniref:hypothetical protein n=1 Tax=Kribbella sp. NPDC051770 TaxID=3155413 RepID=UPI003449243F